MTFLTLLFFSTTKILPELQGIENVPQHMSESIFKEIENCIFRQSLEYRDLEEDNSSFGKTTEQNNTRVNQFITMFYFSWLSIQGNTIYLFKDLCLDGLKKLKFQ